MNRSPETMLRTHSSLIFFLLSGVFLGGSWLLWQNTWINLLRQGYGGYFAAGVLTVLGALWGFFASAQFWGDRRSQEQQWHLDLMEQSAEEVLAANFQDLAKTHRVLAQSLYDFYKDKLDLPLDYVMIYGQQNNVLEAQGFAGRYPQHLLRLGKIYQDAVKEYFTSQAFRILKEAAVASPEGDVLKHETLSEKMLALETIITSESQRHCLRNITSMMEEGGMGLVLPCRFQQKLTGLIVLGRHTDAEVQFRSQEVEVLQTVASHLGVLDFCANVQQSLQSSSHLSFLGELAGSLVHEIRTPLSNINLSSELLLDRLQESDQDLKKALQKILELSESMAKMIKDVQTFTKVRQLNVQEHVLGSIVSKALGLLHAEISRRRLKIKLVDSTSGASFHGDESLLGMMFASVFHFAVSQGANDRELQIKIWEAAPFLRVDLEDAHTALTPAELDEILESYFVVHPSRAVTLGLAFAREIMMVHMGEFFIHALGDRGMRYQFHFPQEKKL